MSEGILSRPLTFRLEVKLFTRFIICCEAVIGMLACRQEIFELIAKELINSDSVDLLYEHYMIKHYIN